MNHVCRTCRHWRPYELYDRDPECESNGYCAWPDASQWQIEGGTSHPPWVNGYYGCRHWRRAWIPLAKMAVLDRWHKLVDWVKWERWSIRR